ncbi:MAG TPA: hypothetical protein EYP88_03255, partial [Anaerolineales bacterium]|nr:hypothetical protein [Anaerolineales bacterium]
PIEVSRKGKGQIGDYRKPLSEGIMGTTENPSFEVNSALLSRCKISILHKLQLGAERGYGWGRVQLVSCKEVEKSYLLRIWTSSLISSTTSLASGKAMASIKSVV